MKTHIINILPHEPDYHYMADEPRPKINWDTPNGNWVGIYRNEIPDKLGGEVLKYTDEFEYEVWQPDYRADKVYSHRFEDGLVHRLFPAYDEKILFGLKYQHKIHSPHMVEYLNEYAEEHRVVVNLNGDLCYLNLKLMDRCGHLPILQTFRGTINLPETLIYKRRLNFLASVSYFKKHLKAKRLMPSIDYVTHQNDLFIEELNKIYKGPKAKITSGCDFSFWQPLDKKACREELDLPKNASVFFTSSLLIPLKQVDKLIEIFKELDTMHDFVLVISGHGTDDYEAYLQELAKPLIEKGKVRFVGYITGDLLKKYYSSSDLFVNTSISEGGPVSAMKAIACGTPVLTTDIGNVAERMRLNGTGILVGIKDYDQWKKAFTNVMEGLTIRPFDREEAEQYYDWQKIAAKFVDIYRYLDRRYKTTKVAPLHNVLSRKKRPGKKKDYAK